MEEQNTLTLQQLVAALDASIHSAIAEPQSAGGEPLRRAESLGLSLQRREPAAFSEGQRAFPASDLAPILEKETALLWAVRERLGRLKLLIDAGAEFYQGIASDPQSRMASSGMDYGVQGEWMERSGGSLLRLDC